MKNFKPILWLALIFLFSTAPSCPRIKFKFPTSGCKGLKCNATKPHPEPPRPRPHPTPEPRPNPGNSSLFPSSKTLPNTIPAQVSKEYLAVENTVNQNSITSYIDSRGEKMPEISKFLLQRIFNKEVASLTFSITQKCNQIIRQNGSITQAEIDAAIAECGRQKIDAFKFFIIDPETHTLTALIGDALYEGNYLTGRINIDKVVKTILITTWGRNVLDS